MALLFEYEKDITTGVQPFMSHERDSVIYNYYIDNEAAMDKRTFVDFGQYDNVIFDNQARHLTTRAVSKIGVKNFPGIGGIGFYKDAYSEESRVVVPIHVQVDKQEAPMLIKVEELDGKLHIVISPPINIKYTCYRIIVRQSPFAFEYITYKTDYLVDLPTVKGDYIVYCIGYDEDMAVVSEDSNELPLTITTGTEAWIPSYEIPVDVNARLAAIETEIKNYPDDDISQSVAGVITEVMSGT